jgi:transcriptional regulator with XRE-family HTH domain
MSENLLADLRSKLGLTQTDFASRMGVPFRTYQDIEAGISKLRSVHIAAAERAALAYAVECGDPSLAPANIRKEALKLAKLVKG